jgi:hypothetical protein
MRITKLPDWATCSYPAKPERLWVQKWCKSEDDAVDEIKIGRTFDTICSYDEMIRDQEQDDPGSISVMPCKHNQQ